MSQSATSSSPSNSSLTAAQWRSRRQRQHVAFRPEVFVQANFRLLLAPTADVLRQADGYDYAPWGGVVQAFVPQFGALFRCPICMEPPMAPRVARCGHVCCLSCFTQLFAMTAKPHRCPLCYEPIVVKALKPAVMLPLREAPSPGSRVHLTLMRRAISSTLPVPMALVAAMPTDSDVDHVLPVVDRSDELPALCFARCLVPTRDAALAIAEREKAQLDSVEAEAVANGDAAALQHVASARALVSETLETISAMSWPTVASAWTDWDGKSPINFAKGAGTVRPTLADSGVTTSNAVPTNDDAAFSDDDGDDIDDDDQRTRLPPGLFEEPVNAQVAASDESDDAHVFFYQSADQQPFFLHPLCMGALVREHGSSSALPLELSAPLVECEARYMDDRQRRRERALAHLPAATNFSMLEVDLRGLVSNAVLSSLQPSLDDRASRRTNEKARLARDERNATQRAEAAAATRAARITSAIQGRAMPAPQQKPNFADFRPLSATVAPSPVMAATESATAQDAWRRLNARSGGGRGGVVHAPEPEYDEEAAYAPPSKHTLSLEDFIVPVRGRRR